MTFVSWDDLGVFSLKSMPRPQFAADLFALIVIFTGVCIEIKQLLFFLTTMYFRPKCDLVIFWPDLQISSDFQFLNMCLVITTCPADYLLFEIRNQLHKLE